MQLNEYQEAAKKTAVFPNDSALEYLTLGLNGEAGEVAEKVKKIIRDSESHNDIAIRMREIAMELGDVLWYLTMLCDVVGSSLEEVAQMNIEKLFGRLARGKLQGDGDNR